MTHRAQTLITLCLLAGLGGCSGDAPGGDARAIANDPTRSVEPASLAAAMRRLPEFSTSRRLFDRAGLTAMLANPASHLTLLVARDSGFAQWDAGARAAILAQDGAATARRMRALMLPTTIRAEELRTRILAGGGSFTATSMAGTPLTFSIQNGIFMVTMPGGSASMGSAELATANGAMYILDRIPAGPAAGTAPTTIQGN